MRDNVVTRPRVLLTRRWPAEVETRLSARYQVTLNEADVAMSTSEIRRAMLEYDAVCPTVSDRLDVSAFPDRPRARILGNFGVGVNHIDLAAAQAADIAVTNTPGVLTDATADLTIGLILMLTRRLAEGERELRQGRWQGWRPTHMMGMALSGRTLGILGMGRIGRAVAQRAQAAFGMKIAYFSRTPLPETELAGLSALACDSVEALIDASDIISLHCPGGGANRHLIDAGRLRRMGPSRYLINTARGDIIDQAALTDALQRRAIGGAGLDVFENEPDIPATLLNAPNAVLLPHLGSATRETRAAMGMMVADSLDAFFDGTELVNRVA